MGAGRGFKGLDNADKGPGAVSDSELIRVVSACGAGRPRHLLPAPPVSTGAAARPAAAAGGRGRRLGGAAGIDDEEGSPRTDAAPLRAAASPEPVRGKERLSGPGRRGGGGGGAA